MKSALEVLLQLDHAAWMDQALSLANEAGEVGEIPVGALIVDEQAQVIGLGQNRKERDHDPTAHAEILAIRTAARHLGDWHLNRCCLYVTLEPCPMCTGAILQARLGLLVYGASDPKTGAVRTVLNLPDSACSFHKLNVLAGVRESDCRQVLKQWFARLRRLHNE